MNNIQASMNRSISILNILIIAIKQADPAKKINITRAITRASDGDEISKNIALNAVCNAAYTSEFLLDIWSEDKSHSEIRNILKEASENLAHQLELDVHPDNMMELLFKEADRGLVYLPVELIRELYKFGKAISDIKHGIIRASEAELNIKQLFDVASDWTEQLENRWGKDNNTVLVPIRPLSKIPF
jgi:hypothetical protein